MKIILTSREKFENCNFQILLKLNLCKEKQENPLLELTFPSLMSITPFCISNLDSALYLKHFIK